MKNVTYRGVKYDAEQFKTKVLEEATAIRNHELLDRDWETLRHCIFNSFD